MLLLLIIFNAARSNRFLHALRHQRHLLFLVQFPSISKLDTVADAVWLHLVNLGFPDASRLFLLTPPFRFFVFFDLGKVFSF